MAMVSDGAALLRAICEHPGEDTPRLIYADWLEENGDTDRAEFIRTQCLLTQLPPGEDGHRLDYRANELLSRHEAVWAAPLRELILWHRFRRGFVEEVGVEGRTFLKRADELFRLAPIRHAFIRTTPAELPAVAASWFLARLRVLRVGSEIGDWGARLLSDSPHLSNLEGLDLFQNRIGPDGATSLTCSWFLSALHALRIGWNGIGDAGAGALARARGLPHLRALDVTLNLIGPEGVRTLADSPVLSRLDTLMLGHNSIGPIGALALARSGPLSAASRLTTLDLTGCELGDGGAQALAAAPWMAHVQRLSFGDNGIGGEGAEALATSPYLERVVHLNLAGNRLTDEDRFTLRARFGMAVRL
jgi:uncharacterized protein (TIGR02996 family)